MKKITAIIMAGALCAGMTACSESNGDEPNETSKKEIALKGASEAYVSNVVLPTYKGMADAAVELYDQCLTIQSKHAGGTLGTEDIRKAGELWKTSRKYWELSEAFLFGPAGDYSIDPHIDSWPLDKSAMDIMLGEIRNGKEYTVDTNLGYGLLGFHSLEYMLFELSADENTSKVHSTSYTPEELKYMVLVAEDLRNQCVLLEACWAGTENVSEEKQRILEEAELDKGVNYGWMLTHAGESGSIFKTFQASAEEIVQGCIDIADEVGNTKIGRPHSSSSEEDKNYIESPYSLNSIEDFVDNIKSIENSYNGVNAGGKSISAYVKSVNPSLDSEMQQALQDAVAAISAIPEPFAKNATGEAAGKAVTVVGTDLVDVLEKVAREIEN